MSFEQKQYWLKGQEHERERIVAIIERLDNHGMTHSPSCSRWHLFAEQALREIRRKAAEEEE